MTTTTSGPGTSTGSVGRWVLHGEGTSRAVLVRPVGSEPEPTYQVAARHRLVQGPDGFPELSLSLVLAGLPGPDEVDVTRRVRQGSLALTTTLAPPDGGAGAPTGVPLYVRDGSLTLRGEPDRELAEQALSGTSLTAALRCPLDRAEALAVLAALDGGAGADLSLVSTLWYRVEQPPGRVRLTGSWADVYDVLAQPPGSPAPDLRALLERSVAAGVVRAEPPGHADAAYLAFAASARAVLLDGAGRLDRRPSAYFTLDLVATTDGSGVEETLTVQTSLTDVLAGCLAGRDRSRAISIVSIGDGGAAPGSRTAGPGAPSVGVPRRVRGAPTRRDVGERSAALVLRADGSLASTRVALSVADRDRANLQLALGAEHLRTFGTGVQAVAMSDLTAQDGSDDLPVVGDPAAWTFPGRAGAPGWYAPSFEVLVPRADEDASTSPFVYSFRRAGTTLDGRAGIEATVTVRLRRRLGDEAAASVQAGPARPVATDDVQVVLDVPFRDASGTTQRQRLAAETTWDGEVVTARVALLDDMARMAYGALSQAAFQVEPARICVLWSLQGLEQRVIDSPDIVWGGKTAMVPLVFDDRPHRVDPPDQPDPVAPATAQAGPLVEPARTGLRPAGTFVDVRTASVVSDVGVLSLRKQRTVQVTRAERLSPLALRAPLLGPDPLARVEGGLSTLPRRRLTWVRRTYVRSQTVDVLFPCSTLGACYVEQRDAGPVAVGCQDALRLGQAPWRQYDEVADLADPAYRVFRSLQQPGHFLVLPTWYVVGRHAEDQSLTPYRPAILMHALLDAADPSVDQVQIQAFLVPQIRPYAWTALRAALRRYSTSPVLSLVTDVECAVSFVWTVVGLASVAVNAVRAAGGVVVDVTSDLPHALLLHGMLAHDGLVGTMALRLPDGTELSTGLRVGLADLAGPAPRGPLEVTVSGTSLGLVNRVERAVDVTAVRVTDDGGSTLVEVPVERSLGPGAAATVQVDVTALGGSPPDVRRCWPVYTVPPAAPAELEEIRSFAEDVVMNVVFGDQVDHAAHGLSRLDVAAQLDGASGIQPVAMVGAVGSTEFVLPLTTYLAQRTVRYRVSATRTDGTTTDGAWQTWDVTAHGNLISLTWESLGLP